MILIVINLVTEKFIIYFFTFYNKYLYKILCFNKNLRILDTITKI